MSNLSPAAFWGTQTQEAGRESTRNPTRALWYWKRTPKQKFRHCSKCPPVRTDVSKAYEENVQFSLKKIFE